MKTLGTLDKQCRVSRTIIILVPHSSTSISISSSVYEVRIDYLIIQDVVAVIDSETVERSLHSLLVHFRQCIIVEEQHFE